MRYYRDLDYFLYIEPMPVARWLGFIDPMPDGTVCIYVNTRVSEIRQRRAIKHELRHLAFNHMWTEERPIEEIENEADNGKGVRFGKDFAWVELKEKPAQKYIMHNGKEIPLFDNGDQLMEYIVAQASPQMLDKLRQAGWNC